MEYQETFMRHEIKYMLTDETKNALLQTMQPFIRKAEFEHTTIRNIYFDACDFRIIRHSLEKPIYKEKLRIRSYQEASADDLIFVELKRKYKSFTYKRRLALPKAQAIACFWEGKRLPIASQIANEIEYFRQYYGSLYPMVFLSYDREAFIAREDENIRITFDTNILYRQMESYLDNEIHGIPLLKEGNTLMEIKSPNVIPFWTSKLLSQFKCYKTSFSKYGMAYQHMAVSHNIKEASN